VPAFTVHRAFASDLAIVYSRNNTEDGRSENFDMEQSGATYAYSLGVGTDLSSTLSMGVSAFALRGSIDTRRQYDWQPLVTSPTEHTFVLEDIASDVGGYGAQIGMQFHMHERVQFGIRINTPTVVNVQSVRTREETEQIANDVGTFLRETTEQETEYILPYRLEGAIALPLPSLLLTAQVSYADWSNAAVDGRRVLTPQTDPVLQKVFCYSAGVEWSARGLPLQLRAGFEYAPTPLKYLQTDRIDNDRIDRVLTRSGRTRVAAGAGVLVRSRIVLDAAWVRTSGSRESSIMNDEYSATLVSLQGTYWF
jgi:long-subunit fatty acid transport protein